MGDQSTNTLRVLRHGSEMTIPASQFNADTDTRLDPETGTSEDTHAAGGSPATQHGETATDTGEKASGRPKKG